MCYVLSNLEVFEDIEELSIRVNLKIEARIPSKGGRQNTLWSVWIMHFSPLSIAKDSKGIQISSVVPSLRLPSSGVAKGRRQYCALKTESTIKEKYCVFNQIW